LAAKLNCIAFGKAYGEGSCAANFSAALFSRSSFRLYAEYALTPGVENITAQNLAYL
jgi:hypothetical protein